MANWSFRPNVFTDIWLNYAANVPPAVPPDYPGVQAQHLRPNIRLEFGGRPFLHRFIVPILTTRSWRSTDLSHGVVLQPFDTNPNVWGYFLADDFSGFPYDDPLGSGFLMDYMMLACFRAGY